MTHIEKPLTEHSLIVKLCKESFEKGLVIKRVGLWYV